MQVDTLKGKVSYLSSKNIYVKFENTAGIEIGDTLYSKIDDTLNPVLNVKYISSKSCSGINLSSAEIKIGIELLAFIKKNEVVESVKNLKSVTLVESVPKQRIRSKIVTKGNDISGRFAISSYGNLSRLSNDDYLRWRYTVSARSKNYNSTNISFDSYISFNYRSTNWSYIKNNISEALKIYSLSVGYDFNKNLNLTLGRKINRNLSNIGAVDGLQFQANFSDFTSGLIVGSRPDYKNYSFNFNLFEYGGFISHSTIAGSGIMQNSLAIFQQTNNFVTDRRFAYFQHNSNFIKQINLFMSSEIDLYKKEKGISSSTFSLTGLYLSLRYRPNRIIRFQASYDSRKNVVYYETFRNYADSIYENATRQGVRFGLNLNPMRNLYLSANYGYRFQENDLRKTQNISGNISYSNLPFIWGTFGMTYNNLRTSYVDGNIYGLRYSRDIRSGMLYATISARRIMYHFINGTTNLNQTIIGADLTMRIMRKLSLSFNYEGTFESNNNYTRFFFNITKRF